MKNYNIEPFKLKVVKETFSNYGKRTYCDIEVEFRAEDCETRFYAYASSMCHESDRYDEWKGRKIAETKALQKVYDRALRRLNKEMVKKLSWIEAFGRFQTKYNKVAMSNHDYMVKARYGDDRENTPGAEGAEE